MCWGFKWSHLTKTVPLNTCNTLKLMDQNIFTHLSPKYVYCDAIEAWSTHTDHDSVGVVQASHFWFRINSFNFIQCLQKGNLSLYTSQVREGKSFAKKRLNGATTPFDVYRKGKHHKIHVKFEFGGHQQQFI